MKNTKAQVLDSSIKQTSIVADLAELVKLKLTLMVVISSEAAYFIVAGAQFNWLTVGLLFFGGLLVSGAASALNQVLEKEFDAMMDRTKQRPLVTGAIKPNLAVLLSGLMSLIGVSLLAFINPLTGLLSMISLLLYSFLYTPMKRHSTLAVAIGAIPGALPILIGSTAFSGSLTTIGLILFGMQFLWQFPHFWSIGYLSKEDYDRAGFKLLPIEEGQIDRNLGLHSSFYAVLLVLLSLSLFYTELNAIGIAITVLLSIAYLICSLNFHVKFDRNSARILMFSSFIYLPFFLISLILF